MQIHLCVAISTFFIKILNLQIIAQIYNLLIIVFFLFRIFMKVYYYL